MHLQSIKLADGTEVAFSGQSRKTLYVLIVVKGGSAQRIYDNLETMWRQLFNLQVLDIYDMLEEEPTIVHIHYIYNDPILDVMEFLNWIIKELKLESEEPGGVSEK